MGDYVHIFIDFQEIKIEDRNFWSINVAKGWTMVSTLIVWGPGSLRSTTALETFAARGAAREHQNPLVRKRIAAWVTLRWSSTCVSSMVIFLHMKHQKICASVHTHTSIYDIWIYAVCKCICICMYGMYMYLHVYTHRHTHTHLYI